MLLGRTVDSKAADGQQLSAEPLDPRRLSPEAAGDLSYMGWYLAHLLPRLPAGRIESENDWQVLVTGSLFAQLLGSRYMQNMIAWAAAQHAENACTPAEKLLCLVARMPGGDVRLHTVQPYLRDPTHRGHFAASRLAEEAYRRADRNALAMAVERLSLFGGESEKFCDPLMELLIAKACQDSLGSGTANLIDLIAHLEHLDQPWRRVYELRICSLFLAETDSQTAGLLVEGFGMLRAELPEMRRTR